MEQIAGGVTAPKGFQAAGVQAGVKKQGKDIALVYSAVPAVAAAVFTTNSVQAAPVLCSKAHLQHGRRAQAVVINSGNANACTGERGMIHANRMCEIAANALDLRSDEVLVASTGVIGVPLPIDRVVDGIHSAVTELTELTVGGASAAEAIMTTDTYAKEYACSVEVDGQIVTIGGMAKGSGMIHPNMATMLGVMTTDAAISDDTLQSLLSEAVESTFNMISVDGDTSTNDTVFVLANGVAKNDLLTDQHPEFKRFRNAFLHVATTLAKQIVADGEGATKLIEVRVAGSDTVTNARKLVQSVLTSNLVKTAFFGEDANWGRILAAMGYSGVAFDISRVNMAFESEGGQIELMQAGEPLPFDEDVAANILQQREILVDIRLGDGDAEATGWGCDLSYDYVRINGDYRT